MTAATITLNVGTGGDKPLVDTLSTVDGAAAPTGASTQMVKIGHGAASDFKTASAANPLPTTATGNGVVSTTNSSTALLLLSGTFTGTAEDVTEYSHIVVSVYASHASATDGLQLQQSTDGTNWDWVDTYTIPATTGKSFSAPVQGKFFRVVFANGGIMQTAFRIATLYSKQTKKGSSVRPQDGRSNENDFDEVLAYPMGYNGASWDRLLATLGKLNVIQPDITASGSLSAPAQTVALALSGQSGAAAQITGTWSGTITFEATLDGTNWVAINAVSASTSTPQTTTTANGLYRLTPGGVAQIRANATALATGSAVVSLRASAGVGGTFANQILPTKNTDGTSTQAIKAASTAAVAADQAAVVSLSPNSPTPAGANIIGALTANQSVNKAQINGVAPLMGNGVSGTGSQRVNVASDNTPFAVKIDQTTPGSTNQVTIQPSTLAVTATAAANTAATLTLPAVAGQFHYITGIEIMRTATAALAGTATLVVTTTNLPGSLAWSFGNAMVAGGTQRDTTLAFDNPLKSSVVNTATTIVMPAPGAAVLWRANIYYYTAA